MRQLFFTAAATVLTIGLFGTRILAGGEAVDPDAQRRVAEEKQRQERLEIFRMATKLLDGKPVRVRIYTDPSERPEAFQQVTVPLKELTLTPDAIRSAYGSISSKMPVVVLGQEQTDEAVATVLDSFIFAGAYGRGEGLYVWPPFFDDPGHEWWVFLDATRQPIPDASVEIGLYVAAGETRIIVGKARLDAQGRLRRIKEGHLYGKFIFTVSHPGYGIGTTECNGLPAIKDSPETYIVPLVPLDSPAAAGACRGTVTDSQGKPVAGVTISCEGLTSPAGERLNVHGGRFLGTGVTNEQGRFAGYWPILEDGVLSDDLVPAGSLYQLRITPSKSLNLRQYEASLVGGAEAAVTLSAMQADQFFHTFAFEGHAGPITDSAELKHTVLTLIRDSRPWAELTYDQWKDGYPLPLGTLRATARRGGNHFSFEPVDLSADTPQEIVIREPNAVTYRGKIVDGATGEPMPNVLVGVGSMYAGRDPCSLTAQQWQDMRNRAAAQVSARFPDKLFYESDNRLTVTDANGEYEVVFLPGTSAVLSAFVAMQPGYALSSTSIPSYIRPDEDGIVQVPALRLAPPAPLAPSYVPTFVFEDENGPVTDPNKLKSVRLEVNLGDGQWQSGSVDYVLERREFMAGTYRATATWQGKYYVFEPVDLSVDRPATVVFKPREILPENLIYQGQVIHGVTGRPIPQALVMDCRLGGGPDVSELTAEQWKAIKAAGPDFDPANPALAPLMQAIADGRGTPTPRLAMTDAQGRFRIAVSRTDMNFGGLAILDRDFLCTEQQLARRVRPTGDPEQPSVPVMFGPEVNGQMTLAPIKLFPAGTALFEPILPVDAYSDIQKPRLKLCIVTDKDDPTPWLKGLLASSVDNAGAFVQRRKDLRPNMRQSLHVPADVRMSLLLYGPHESHHAPLIVTDVMVKQGQTLDLGRLEFGPGVTVTVKVVDSAGNPVKAMRLHCMDAQCGDCGLTAPTSRDGTTQVHVAPSTQGRFVAYYFGRSSQDRMEASVAYEIAGPEDNGREFVLQLPDAFIERLREADRERQQEAMPIQPLPASRYPAGSRR